MINSQLVIFAKNQGVKAAFFLQGLILFLVAPLQVDPHHDGIILGAAVASANGRFGPGSAFSQYGPLSPLIHGFFLDLTSSSMLNLRYFAALNTIFISFLLFKVLSKISSRRISILTSTSWVFTSAIWATTFPGALLAWPSLISTALILMSLNLLLPIFMNRKDEYKLGHLYIYLAGVLLGLSGFARQQTWLAAALTLLLFIFFQKSYLKYSVILISGVVTSLVGMFGWLGFIGAWDSYINQVIIWPLSAYSTLGANNNYNRYQFGSYVIQGVVFVLALYFVSTLRILRISQQCVYLIFTSISGLVVASGFWIAGQSSWQAAVRVTLGEPQEKLILSFMYFGCIAAIVLSGYLIPKIKMLARQGGYEKLVLAIFGLVGVIQLYPQPDVLHLWWIAPLVLPSAVIGFESIVRKSKRLITNDLVYVQTSFALVGIVLAIKFVLQPWAPYEVPVLNGTYSFSAKAEAINEFNQVQKYIKRGETSFDCPDGVFAVSDGNYNSADEWFVNWGMLDSEAPEVGKVRIICYRDIGYAESEATRLGMELKAFVGSTNPNTTFAVLLREQSR